MGVRKTVQRKDSETVVATNATKPVAAKRAKTQTAVATVSKAITGDELTRTHKALGLFPHALLLLGYGESKPEKEREFTVQEKNVQTGENITRHMKVYTKSDAGLPRGRDPQVLLALVNMVFKKPEISNSVWFRKADLLEVLGWTDTPENRQDIEQALERYFDTAYRGLSITQSKTRDREHEKVRRIITGYDRMDERLIRHKVAQQPFGAENERLFSKVVFDQEFINDIRGDELSLTINLQIMRALNRSSIAIRLYEVINYLTTPDNLSFSVPILELAHERLGMSKTLKSPSQCWQKIEKAGQKLLEAQYLLTFDYLREDSLVVGTVNPTLVSPQAVALEPLPKADEKRNKILQQFLNLGTYQAATEKLLQQLPDELLDDAEIIADFVTREKGEGHFARSFRWGGRAYNQLKYLVDNGEINQTLLNKHLSEIEDGADKLDESGLDDGRADELSLAETTGEKEVFPDPNDALQGQLPLSISIENIEVVDEQAHDLWNKCVRRLSKKLAASIIETWFTDKTVLPKSVQKETLNVEVCNEQALEWIVGNYQSKIQTALDETTKTKDVWRISWTVAA